MKIQSRGMFNIVYFENSCFLEYDVAERDAMASPVLNSPRCFLYFCHLILETGFPSSSLCPGASLGDQPLLLGSKTGTLTSSGC